MSVSSSCWLATAGVCLAFSGTGHAEETRSDNPSRAHLQKLLAAFSRSAGLEATFSEEKHMAILRQPIQTEGTIHFSPPHRLARHVLRPVPSVLIVDATNVTMADPTQTQRLDLTGNPVIAMFVESFMLILQGRLPELERLYEIDFAPAADAASWRLRLKPTRDTMRKIIEKITLEGRGLSVQRLRISEVGGDWTVTTFTNVQLDRQYSPAESSRLFRPPEAW